MGTYKKEREWKSKKGQGVWTKDFNERFYLRDVKLVHSLMKKVEEMRRIGKGPGRKFFFFSLFESRSFWKSFVNKGMENRYLFLCLRVSFIIRGRYLTERTSFLHT